MWPHEVTQHVGHTELHVATMLSGAHNAHALCSRMHKGGIYMSGLYVDMLLSEHVLTVHKVCICCVVTSTREAFGFWICTLPKHCMTLQAKELEEEMDAAFIDVEYQLSVESCKDHDVSQHAVLSSHPQLVLLLCIQQPCQEIAMASNCICVFCSLTVKSVSYCTT